MTDIARSMVTRYGMSKRMGGIAYERDPQKFLGGADLPQLPHEHDHAEKTAAAIDEEVRALVDEAMARAMGVLRQKRDVLERSAQQLLQKETLDENDLPKPIGPPAGPMFRVAAE